MNFDRAIRTWVLTKHNEHETSVIHRLMSIDQIDGAHFNAEEGWRYSEYTAEGPSVVVEYQYTANGGKKHWRAIDIDGQEVGPFVEEIARLASEPLRDTSSCSDAPGPGEGA